MKRTFIILSTIVFQSCEFKSENQNTTQFPKILDTPITFNCFSAKQMQSIRNIVFPPMQLGSCNDTLNLLKIFPYRFNEISSSHFDSTLTTEGLEIFIDTSQPLKIEFNDIIDPNTIIERGLSIRSTSSLTQWHDWDKIQKRYIRGYPVFLYNYTKNVVRLENQDQSIFIIQEAKDKNGEFRPIEFWSYSWCGESYGSISIKPNNFMLMKLPIYTGEFTTELRLKIKNGNNIYYSNTFMGKINIEQFELPANYNDNRIARRLAKDDYLKQIFLDK